MAREEDINNSGGVVNLSTYGFPKGEGSVSAPSLTVGNNGFLLPTSTSTWVAKRATVCASNSQLKRCSPLRRRKWRRWTVPWRRRPNLLQNYENF